MGSTGRFYGRGRPSRDPCSSLRGLPLVIIYAIVVRNCYAWPRVLLGALTVEGCSGRNATGPSKGRDWQSVDAWSQTEPRSEVGENLAKRLKVQRA